MQTARISRTFTNARCRTAARTALGVALMAGWFAGCPAQAGDLESLARPQRGSGMRATSTARTADGRFAHSNA